MSGRLRLTLSVMILLAGSFLVFQQWGKPQGASAAEGDEELEILVAGRYLPAFQPLLPGMVRAVAYPRNLVPPGALRHDESLKEGAGQPRFVTLIGVPEGQPITRALVEEAGQRGGLSRLLPSGKVAFSFSVDRDRMAGGWVQPGDTVAILHSLPEDPRRSGARTVRLLFPAVQVLAVDQSRLGQPERVLTGEQELLAAGLPEMGTRVLTVRLNPWEATALAEAREKGPLTVVLRPGGDDFPW